MGSWLGYVKALANVGVDQAATERRRFQTRAANAAGLAFTVASLPYIPLEYGMGAPLFALATVISCLVYPLALPLNRYGFSRLGRGLPLVTATCMVWVAMIVLTPACQVQIGLIMIGTWAFAVYDTREEWPYLAGILVLTAVVYLSASFGWLPQLPGWKPSPELIQMYTWLMPVSTIGLSSVVMSLIHLRNQGQEDRLLHANKTLAEAHQRAMLGEKSKAEFLAVMSHEIRTPLNGMLGCAELLKTEPLTRDQQHWLKTLVSSSEQMLELMTHILDYSRLDSGGQVLHESVVDIESLVREAVESFGDRAAAKGLALGFEAEGQLPARVLVDPGHLRLIISNLISNAVKYTAHGKVAVGLRSVSVSDQTTLLEVRVQDTGPGVAADLRQAIFESFRQAEDFGRRRQGGVGLGLAICKAATNLMKGRLEVESVPGQGCTFKLVFPVTMTQTVSMPVPGMPKKAISPAPLVANLAEQTERADAAPPVVQTSVVSQSPISSKHIRRILIADDQPTNQRILQKLAERFGEHVMVVENGALALDAWQKHAPDVILMDIQMPVMDGLAATRAIRAHEKALTGSRHTAIVAVTANAMPEQRAEGLAAGVDVYLTKPIRIAELREALERLCPPTGSVDSEHGTR